MKKFLLLVPVVALLAASCNSSTQTSGSNTVPETTNTVQTSGTNPAGSNSTSTMMDNTGEMDNSSTTSNSMMHDTGSMSGSASSTMSMTGAMWQGTLQASNDSSKGKYMLKTSDNHTIYINTNKDFSSMVGQSVNVDYTGTMDNFILNNITSASASGTMMMTH